MNEPSLNNPFLVDSLNHPLAGPIRKLLTREGRRELNQIIVDDEENILQALQAGIEIDSVYYAGDEVVSDTLRKNLTAGATIHEVAKRTTKKLFENDKISRIFAIAETPKPVGLEALAATLNEEADTLVDVVEPFLLKAGLLRRTPRGREATQTAREHLGLAVKRLL